MWKAGIAAVVMLAGMGSSLAFAQTEVSYGSQNARTASSAVLVSYAQIARLKSDLKLTPEQEPLWPAVERAFRDIARQQSENSAAQGVIQGIKARAAAVGMNALALRQVAAAAYPLIRTLNAEQKQCALAFARAIGLDSVVASF
jgi:zinc resistance-associated protein